MLLFVSSDSPPGGDAQISPSAKLRDQAAALRQDQRAQEAHDLLSEGVRRFASDADIYFDRGELRMEIGDTWGAIEDFRAAVGLRPTHLRAWVRMGNAAFELGHTEPARIAHETALGLAPDNPTLHYNLGCTLMTAQRPLDAETHFRTTLALAPDHARARINLAQALRRQERLAEAIEMQRAALAVDPDNAFVHFNLADSLLASGAWREGFAEYEWRRRMPSFKLRALAAQWDGRSALDGKTFLIRGEQGLGDQIQFCRLARNLKARRAARIVLEASPVLVELLRNADAVDQVVAFDEDPGPFDCESYLLSLPHLLDDAPPGLTGSAPYLRAPPVSPSMLRPLSGASRLRVGVAWQGNPDNPNDAIRSIPLADLLPALASGGAQNVSIQRIHGLDQLAQVRSAQVLDLGSSLPSFADLAAAVGELDLVVTIDSAVAHLAGALGRDTWLLLAKGGDWRWGVGSSRSPYYPTMTIFRQASLGEWSEPLRQIHAALQDKLRSPE